MAPRLARIALAGVTALGCAPAAAEDIEPGDVQEFGRPRDLLNTPREVFAALQACNRPPPLAHARPGMQITFRLSFKQDGSILGEPRVTFETREVSEPQRYAYRLAVAEALQRCTPLPFSESLGHAVAGRPFTLRIIDRRGRFGI